MPCLTTPPTCHLPGIGKVFEGSRGAGPIIKAQVDAYFAEEKVAELFAIPGGRQLTIIDVGANVGLFAMACQRLALASGNTARIICFGATAVTFCWPVESHPCVRTDSKYIPLS